MEIIHGRDLEFVSSDKISKHREGGIGFKFLATGDEGTPENFVCLLARQAGFYSPAHRHNFDQFRYAYKGDFSLKPHLTLKQGQVSYHPEGVYYGPQNDGEQEQMLLLLQFGGASGQGFIPYKRLKAANEALSKKGEFKGGKFYSSDGKHDVVDGYQAIWEHLNGRKLVYPGPRYHDPILMDPVHFAYRPYTEGDDHAFRKVLGVFSEREVRVEMLKISAQGGKLSVGGGDRAIHILVVLDGRCRVGDEDLTVESTIKLPAGTSCEAVSTEGVEMLHFVTPLLS